MAKILIVDDRPINRKFLLTLLGYSNDRLLEAGDGTEALKIIRAEHPDLVITDLVMPTMDGFALVRQMRNDPEIADTQVIFYTATYRLQESKELAQACGVSIVIPKPSEPETILLTVNSALLHIKPPSNRLPQAVAAVTVPELPLIKETLGAYLEDLRATNERMSRVIERGAQMADQEARLTEVSEKLRQALGGLQGSSLKLATLIELGLELASQRDPERLATIFCHAAQDVIVSKYAVLGILAHDGETLALFIAHGADPENLKGMNPPPPLGGILGSLIKEPRPRRLRDLSGDPQSLGLPSSHPPIHSFLGFPIASSLQVYGWFYLVDRLDADEFSESDEQIAVTLAAQFAVAYESARLYDEVQHHAAKLQLESARRAEAEERYRNIFENAAEGIFRSTPDGRYLVVNPATAYMLGYDSSEELTHSVTDIGRQLYVDPSRRKEFRRRMEQENVVHGFEVELYRKDRSKMWASFNARAARDPPGKILHYEGLIEDITERKQAEQKLREQVRLAQFSANIGASLAGEDTLRSMLQGCAKAMVRDLDAAFARIWTLNPNESVLEMQASAGMYTHLDGAHGRVPVGQYKIGLIASERKPHLTNKVVGDPRVHDQEWAKREGMIAFAGYPLLVENRLVGVMAMFARKAFTDSTLQSVALVASQIGVGIERKLAQEVVRQSEERFRELAENIHEVFFIAGIDGNPIYYISPAYEQVWGRTCESLYQNPGSWLDNIHADDLPRVQHVLTNNAVDMNEEYRIVRPDGTLRWLHSRCFPVKDSTGKTTRLVGIAEDITERKAAEARLRLQSAALESAANGIVITDSRGTIVWVNPAFTALTGYSANEAIGANPRILKSGLHDPSFYANLWATIVSGRVWQGEMINRRKDGTFYTEEQILTPVMDARGKILHFIAVKQDISRRKAAEAASERNLTRIRALHEIDLAINSTLDLHAVLDLLLDNMDHFLPSPSAGAVRLLNKDTGILEPIACRNLDLDAWKTEMSGSGREFGVEIIASGKPLHIANVQTDPRTRNIRFIRSHGLTSFLGVPLLAKDEVLGILTFFTKEKHNFTDEEIEFLSTLAGQAAIVICNAQLYEQTSKQAEDLRAANESLLRRERIQELLKEINQDSLSLNLLSLLQKLADRVREFMHVDISDIRIMEPEGTRPIVASGASLEELCGRAGGESERRAWYLENRRALTISDTSENRLAGTGSLRNLHLRGYLGAPLFSRSGALMGVLRALTRRPRDFSQEEIDLIEQLAHGAATAMENSQLYRELEITNAKLQEREEIQRLLKELSQDITTMDLQELLQKLSDRARDFLKVDICDIRIREPGATRVMGASGIEPQKLQSSAPGQGRARLKTYRETREPILVSDLRKDHARVSEGSTAFRLGVRGYLGVSFFSKGGQFLGIMRAMSYQPRNFSQQEADLLRQLADGAAIAVENARLYRDLERSDRAKTEFLGVMSHELRTPLNVIIGYTDLMTEGVLGQIEPRVNDGLKKIARQSKDLLSMVERIMEAAKIESGSVVVEQHEANLTNFLSDLRSSYDIPVAKDVSLAWDYPGDLPVIKTDRVKLTHILHNLIDNALKFTDTGTVTVSARVIGSKRQRAKSGAQSARSKEQGARNGQQDSAEAPGALPTALGDAPAGVEFSVKDTGVGIAVKDLPVIFELFHQIDSSDARPYEGVGLGLYIVKEFTKLLGGTAEVVSKLGEGSTFIVTIPCER